MATGRAAYVELPEGVTFTDELGEWAPYAGLTIVDGDWSLSVTVMPVKRDADRVELGELVLEPGQDIDPEDHPKPWSDAPQERWDAAIVEALEYLLRMKAER